MVELLDSLHAEKSARTRTDITRMPAASRGTFRALVFDPDTWAAFEKVAQSQGKTARQLISTAVAGSLGTVMMDNYSCLRHTNVVLHVGPG